MVFREAASAFWKNSRLPLSSTMQMVTSTCRFWASTSAAATIVLMAAKFRYFLVGRSAAKAVAAKKASIAKSSLSMGRMLPLATQIFQMKSGNACKADGRKICSILLLAIFGPIVRLQVENDFPRVFIRDRCAEGFVHLVDLGFPGGGGQRRLHGDVPRAVAGVAIKWDFWEPIPGDAFQSGHRICRNLIVRSRQQLDGRSLRQASKFNWSVVAFLKVGENEPRRHHQAAHHEKNR